MRYRKKPVEVEAVQWTGENLEKIREFCGDKLQFVFSSIYINILEGSHRVSLNDYIIRRGGRMKLFKSVDEKLSEIGFKKFYESDSGADYEKYVKSPNFAHKVSIERKGNGKHLLWSYTPDAENIGVGLTGYEMKLFLKKMKQTGLYSK